MVLPSADQGLIYDVGMNIAEDTPYYLAKGFRVVAIEANPQMVDNARQRFAAEIAAGNLILVQGAVAKARGSSLTFYICDTMSALSTTEKLLVEQHKKGGAVFHEVEVEAIPFADILRTHGMPHYMKVDIEGCDLLCLEALHAFNERPESLSVEVSFYNYRQLMQLAATLGYTKFQLIPQSSIAEQRVPVPSREGKDTDFRFVSGCSGLFGRDLPEQDWKSHAKTLSQLTLLLIQHKIVGAITRLGKLLRVQKTAQSLGRTLFPKTNAWYDVHMTR
jgi:FkbM family methyltransferase